MGGAVHIQPDGDSVAAQLWPQVSKIISFSSDIMRDLLQAIGVTPAEMSPFCREFASLEDLKQVYIAFLPHTFRYEGVHGSSAVADSEEGSENDDDDDDDGSKTQSMLGERIKMFAKAMSSKEQGDDDDDGSTDDSNKDVTEIESSASATNVAVTTKEVSVNASNRLMTGFRSLIKHASSDFGDSLEHILQSSAYLANGEHTSGSISFARKVKSLVERWIARPAGGLIKDGTELVADDKWIERGVIILVSVKVGAGAAATTVRCKYRVLEIHEKYYNKWFVSLDSRKRFQKEKKRYKVQARMVVENGVNEYSDVAMYESTFNKDDIVRNIEDCKIIDVVGKLVAV